jgi:CRP-like cAMP-binding protein
LSNEDYGITAINDLKLMIFNTESIGELLNKSPGLAAEVGEAIQARRLAAHEARRHK